MSASEFAGKAVVVTGAAAGMGRAIALRFAEAGANVIAADVKAELIAETARLRNPNGGELVGLSADVRDESAVAGLINECVSRFGTLDIMVNNAAVLGPWNMIGDLEQENFDLVFDVNVRGLFFGMKHAVRVMAPRKSGVIINLASVQGFRVMYPGSSLYAASKAAVMSLTKSAALEYGQHGIRVAGIAPGPIDTPMLRSAVGEDWPPPIQSLVPLGFIGDVSDIADTAIWLASSNARYISGAILPVDGGLLAP